MPKPKSNYARSKRNREALGQALDLELPNKLTADTTADIGDEDTMLVHNRRSTGKKNRISTVLPGDAHKTMEADQKETAFAAEEEEILAEEANKILREELDDDDFAIPGFKEAVESVTAQTSAAAGSVSTEAVAVEKVARDFSELTQSEQLQLLQKQSPELLKMFTEMKTRLSDVQRTLPQTNKLRDLITAQKRKKIQTTETSAILTFLETKLQLLLSYCIHINFYLLLKAEGKKVENHPVVDRLLEIRVYLEKLWPLEQKLGYTLSKLLTGGTQGGASQGNRARLANLRSVADEDGGVYRPTKNAMLDSDAARRKKALEAQEAADLEAEETSLMTRARAAKKGKDKNQKSLVESAPNEAEPEDHFFTKIVHGDEDDDIEGDAGDVEHDVGMSLVDRLKARQQRTQKVVTGLQEKSKEQRAREAALLAQVPETMDDVDDELGFGDEEGEEDLEEEYQRFLAEEGEEDDLLGGDIDAEYQEEDASRAAGREAQSTAFVEEDDAAEKRGATKKILSNRGATKSRPKDSKTPHTNRKRKVKKGENIAKASSKSFKPEAPGGFSGVTNFKPHLTKSRSMV